MTSTVVGVHLADDPEAWARAGFTVHDDSVVVGSVRITLGVTGAPGWMLQRRPNGGGTDTGSTHDVTPPEQPDPSTIDGIPTRWVHDAAPAAPSHPNACSLLDHVVIATPDVDRTAAAFEALGMRVRGRRDAGTPNRPMRQVFVRDGAVIIEIVGPAVVDDDPTVRARPATVWGLAFASDDLDACAQHLGANLGPVRDAVQPGRRIASLRHRDLGISVPVAIMTH